jgi:hypothetical protein
MTTPTENRLSTYIGNGVATSFPFNFNIPEEGAEVILIEEIATGIQTRATPSEYTITGLGDVNGGTVTYPLSGSPLSSDFKILITRDVSLVQTTSVSNQTAYFAEVVERVWDRLTMMIQDTRAVADRAVKTTEGGADITITPGDEDDVPVWDDGGNLIPGPTTTQIASAQGWGELAQKFAENPEDTFVDNANYPGQYSARHHALKAAASASTASTKAVAADNSATAAANSATAAATSASDAQSDASAAATSAGIAATEASNAAASAAAAAVSEGLAAASEAAALNHANTASSAAISAASSASDANSDAAAAAISAFDAQQAEASATAAAAATKFTFETVADMKASTAVVIGDVVSTRGYEHAADGGGATYEIVVAATGTDDGGSFHDLTGISGQAKLLYSQGIKAEWWGCTLPANGVPVDRAAEFNAAFAFAADLSRDSRSDPQTNMLFTCDADFLSSETLQLRKSSDNNCEVDVYITGRITATTGGGLESHFGGTFVSGGVPVTTSASTPALPLLNVRCRRSQLIFGEIDCNFLCSGIRYQGAGGTTCRGQDLYHFRDYGHLTLSRSNNALVVRWNNVKQWLLGSEDSNDFGGRMASGGNTNQNNYTGNCYIAMQKDHRLWGGHWGWSRCAVLLMDQYPNRDAYGEDKYYDGLSSEANFTETSSGTGDVYLYGLHFMQGFGGNASSPRFDNVEKGGPIDLECFNKSNAAYVIGADFDAGTIQLYGDSIRFAPGCSFISGGTNKFPNDSGNDADRVVVVDPRCRIYADGSGNPSSGIIGAVPGMTVGVFPRAGYSDFGGDYTEWNKLNQPTGGVGTLNFDTFLTFDAAGRDARGIPAALATNKVPTSASVNDLYIVAQDMDVLTDNSIVLRGAGGTVAFPLNRGDYVIITATYSGNTNRDWLPGSMVRTEYGDVQARSSSYEVNKKRLEYNLYPRDDTDTPDEVNYRPGGVFIREYTVGGITSRIETDGDSWRFANDGAPFNFYIGNNNNGISTESGNLYFMAGEARVVEINGQGRILPVNTADSRIGTAGSKWEEAHVQTAFFDFARIEDENSEAELRLSSYRQGPNYYNAGIRFDTPRGDTADGGRQFGRAMIVSLGNAVDNDPVVWLSTRTAGANTADTDADIKNYNGMGVRVSFEFELWRNNTQLFRIDSVGNAEITGNANVAGNLKLKSWNIGSRGADLSVSGGALSAAPDSQYHVLEVGTPQDVNVIDATNAESGTVLMFTRTSSSANITFKTGVNNIECGVDRVLSNQHSTIAFIRSGTKWKLLHYQAN